MRIHEENGLDSYFLITERNEIYNSSTLFSTALNGGVERES